MAVALGSGEGRTLDISLNGKVRCTSEPEFPICCGKLCTQSRTGFIIKHRRGVSVIGLRLRYDRKGYFLFTLLHEAAHIVCGHVKDYLADDLLDPDDLEKVEREANELVEVVTIPAETFHSIIPDPAAATLESAIRLVQECDVDVSIVAGRVQYKANEYRKFSRLVGRGRAFFEAGHSPAE